MATIVALPTAAAYPVSSRRRGRFPKNVISLRDFKSRQNTASLLKQEIEERLKATDHLRNAMTTIMVETEALRQRYESLAHGHL